MTTANRPRIYIAGPMNPRNGGGAIEYLANCRRMMPSPSSSLKKDSPHSVPPWICSIS